MTQLIDTTGRTYELDKFVREVKDWANSHYEKLGWDILVECCDDSEIRAAIGAARTTKGAIDNAWKKLVRSQYMARRAVRAECF